jgi:hypothetical protein
VNRIVYLLGLIFFGSSTCAQELNSFDTGKCVIDYIGLLNQDEVSELEEELKEYWEETGNAVFIRVDNRADSGHDAESNGKTQYDLLKEGISNAKSITLIYVEAVKAYKDENIFTEAAVFYDWNEIAKKAENPDDHYYARTPTGKGLIAYRLELKVLFTHFSA